MKTITVRDLRQRWPKAEAMLEREKEITITRDGKPVAKLVRVREVEAARKRFDPRRHARWQAKVGGRRTIRWVEEFAQGKLASATLKSTPTTTKFSLLHCHRSGEPCFVGGNTASRQAWSVAADGRDVAAAVDAAAGFCLLGLALRNSSTKFVVPALPARQRSAASCRSRSICALK
jgi:antitoxin (DNA-binding transcriptional repressor) of toxin-antitoxin stability system